MGIYAINSKKVHPTQGVQKVHGQQDSQSQKVQGSSQGSGSSLVERLNNMDNKLNQGGGVSLPGEVQHKQKH
jgi:hypothetical protein